MLICSFVKWCRIMPNNPMDFNTLSAVVGIGAGAMGIIFGWLGRSRSIRKDVEDEAGKNGRLQADVDYIKRGVDEMRREMSGQVARVEILSERITRVEEI